MAGGSLFLCQFNQTEYYAQIHPFGCVFSGIKHEKTPTPLAMFPVCTYLFFIFFRIAFDYT